MVEASFKFTYPPSAFTGAITSNAGVIVDNITIDGEVISLSSGSLQLDVAGDITLDAGGGDIVLGDDGTQFGSLTNSSSNLIIKSGSTTAATFSGANVTFAGTLASGAITSSGDVTAFSDARLKTGIRNIDNALNMVGDMRGVYFIKDGEAGTGVIAQEVEKVLPEVVKNNEEYKSVAYGNLSGYLIETIKDQQKQIDELKALVEKLVEKL